MTNDPRPPVPDLIERYRLRRDAWIAQADELARLRDEVRSAAERECSLFPYTFRDSTIISSSSSPLRSAASYASRTAALWRWLNSGSRSGVIV